MSSHPSQQPVSLFYRLFFLPDHWLRRVDFGVALLSVLILCAHVYTTGWTSLESPGQIAWAITALISGFLWFSHGTSRILQAMRRHLPEVMLWIVMRFG